VGPLEVLVPQAVGVGDEQMSNEKDWKSIQSDYESGLSLRHLAAKYGVSKSTIERHAKMGQWDGTAGRRDTPQAPSDENPTPQKEVSSTKESKRLFLEAYAEHANVMLAAKAADIHRSTVYDWQEHDQDFSFAFNLAREDAKDILRAEIYRRAKEGWDEPLVSAGMRLGRVRKYSDTLLIFHSKMLMPEYRDKHQVEVSGPGGAPIQVQHLQQLTNEELDALERLVSQVRERATYGS